ncbi:hypothetical protein HYALB_00009419 [Hymenoscyphus albidus]|uniref:Uncharacterized protein n=1 Tax=Hymenoscyphus albidus TaxID=595503 RepID=A0A9N9Q741_9HELO|nr:hypothetical protein HYALB_00009419 [Hymenoscyphus albidus]
MMTWSSILPESFLFIEIWAVRIFLLLGFIAIGPWILLIVYDVLLYIFRTATYEIPYVGGRARNRPRPRAPSLSERPSGTRRRFSLTLPGAQAHTISDVADAVDGVKQRMQRPGNQRTNSNAIDEYHNEGAT